MPRRKKSDSISNVDYARLQEKIIENLIDLQKVHTNMAEKFDNLSSQITNLLNLFESAARSFAEHPANIATEKDKEFLNKIDKLLEQNKVIAKGLTMMEDRIRDRMYSGGPNNEFENESMQNIPNPAPPIRPPINPPSQPINKPLPKF